MVCIILPNALFVMGAFPNLDDPRLMLFIALMNGIGFMGFTGVVILSNSMMADVADALELQTS